MAQYDEIRRANPNCLIFFRMGDFYELFFEDAKVASSVLGITLTARGRQGTSPIPMAGVPLHASSDYLNRLIDAGYRVAICEQVEDPKEAKKRGYKAIVRREVIRIATAGTLTEDQLLDSRAHNFLLSLASFHASDGRSYALAWTDISTGDLSHTTLSGDDLCALVAQLDPREILLSDTESDPLVETAVSVTRAVVTRREESLFDSTNTRDRLDRYFTPEVVRGLSSVGRSTLSVMGALLEYIDFTQVGARPSLGVPKAFTSGTLMAIDEATLANLEIQRSRSGDPKASLLSIVDRCITGAGSRKMAEKIRTPLICSASINARLDATAFFYERDELRRSLRSHLRHFPDLLRSLNRIKLGRAEPRDLESVRRCCETAGKVRSLFDTESSLPELLSRAIRCFHKDVDRLNRQLLEALSDKLPATRRDGGFIRAGYHARLDEVRVLRDKSRELISGLRARYESATQIKSLKIKHNNLLGYFIEVPAQAGERLLAQARDGSSQFIHRQSMAGAHRFVTRELTDLEVRILQASDQAQTIENELFDALGEGIVAKVDLLRLLTDALAELDGFSALAELAVQETWLRPKIDDSLTFQITKGRHPFVEASMRNHNERFVANDCDLSPTQREACGQIVLLTGPNMAGKSTYLRQNALIVLLGQIGSFVPAQSAHFGVVDRLYCRAGAGDDLARGRSTFMVEMVETAAILNRSTKRSLVILDEIGRGTATFDGLSIAWASVEHLHDVNGSRALFATHFHELTALAKKLSRLRNATLAVKMWKGEIVFLREVIAGVAQGSYGIRVARLAGLPERVVKRAASVLSQLEKNDRSGALRQVVDDLPLFASSQTEEAPEETGEGDRLLAELSMMDMDALSPRAALETLFKLQAQARTINGGS